MILTKGGKSMKDMLQIKHLSMHILDHEEDLGETPPLITLKISEEIFEKVTITIGSGFGLGRI